MLSGVSPGRSSGALVDFEAKDESRTLLRDRVCEAILRRQPVLHLIERHAFHVNPTPTREVEEGQTAPRFRQALRDRTPQGDPDGRRPIRPWSRRQRGSVTRSARPSPTRSVDKKKSESGVRPRGALFRLRKTRTTADFMNELARLQFRYEINVPRDILDGQTFNPETFEEFRGFCVVAALNRFLFAARETSPTTIPSK